MHDSILSLLKLAPSPQSLDYINNKTQFQLHTLVTEQRHPRTWDLSSVIQRDMAAGLEQILSVDLDLSQKIIEITDSQTDMLVLQTASKAVSRAILGSQKIFIYGCGATGRLAKQMESAIWRPFWNWIKQSDYWETLHEYLPRDITSRLIGEMTGGDRALISSLEGFEDLQLIGQLQIQDRRIQPGDVVFAITEGGETSSVIGAVLAAREQYGELSPDSLEDVRSRLYFMYNNPDEVLQAFDRSRAVIEHPFITKINLTTGPQAVTGSTRMQAATIETFVMGTILEAGIQDVLEKYLSVKEMKNLGFIPGQSLKRRLLSFDNLRSRLLSALKDITQFTGLESDTYKKRGRTTYFAGRALIPVFIDCTERSPTFRLDPLDTVKEPEKKSWMQVKTDAADRKSAWQRFLGRPFRGLDKDFYSTHFLFQIEDQGLLDSALKSLTQAGRDQEDLYDFSFDAESKGTENRSGLQPGDLGVVVCVDDELEELENPDSSFSRFIQAAQKTPAKLALIVVGEISLREIKRTLKRMALQQEIDAVIAIPVGFKGDPLELNRQTLLKMLLNAHSTAVMARLGRVVGNTMTHVHPSNLKLIGRATYLIQSHVNDTLQSETITYAEANAVLFDAMDFQAQQDQPGSEVALSIIRILESYRSEQAVSWEEAVSLLNEHGLGGYLERHNPGLRKMNGF